MNNNIYTLDFHPVALLEYDESYIWYELQLSGLGQKFVTQIKKKLAQIVAMPETFSVKNKKQYREAKVDKFPYTITYKILTKKRIVFITAIHHQKKHPNKKYR